MARARKPTLNLEMYRHFAIVTIVLTGTIALFAEGESGAFSTPPVAQVELPANATVQFDGSSAEPLVSNWADEPLETGSFGSEVRTDHFDNASSIIPADFGSDLASRGYSPEYLARLSDDERIELIKQLQGRQDASITAAEKRRAERLSSMRSGAQTLD